MLAEDPVPKGLNWCATPAFFLFFNVGYEVIRVRTIPCPRASKVEEKSDKTMSVYAR
jgi:hypothetical protein